MTDRLALLALVVVGFLLLGLWLRLRPRILTAHLRAGALADLGLNRGAAVLAFTSPDCVACETAQRPALQALRARTPHRVAIREMDVLAFPDLVRMLGIFSVPSTVIVNRGEVTAINIGYASVDRLLAQLSAARVDGAPAD